MEQQGGAEYFPFPMWKRVQTAASAGGRNLNQSEDLELRCAYHTLNLGYKSSGNTKKRIKCTVQLHQKVVM